MSGSRRGKGQSLETLRQKGSETSSAGVALCPSFFTECRRALPGETGANRTGDSASPVAAPGRIGQVVSRSPINMVIWTR